MPLSAGIALLLASQAAGPVIAERIDYKPLESEWHDLPYWGQTNAAPAMVFYKLVISPAGRVDKCEILVSDSNQEFRAKFCSFLKGRDYRPARNAFGQPTYGVSEAPFSLVYWSKPSTRLETGPDYQLDLQKLPDHLPDPPEVWVAVEVDPAGGFKSCAIPELRLAKKVKATTDALAKVACAQLPAIWDSMPEKDGAGVPIAYVRKIRVAFQAATPKPAH